MSRAPFANTTALAAYLGEAITNTVAADTTLRQASEIIRAYAGQDWLTDGGALDSPPDQLADIVLIMVERATGNPDGVTGTLEVAGPFTRQRQFGAAAADRLFLTKGEKAIIRHAIDSRGVGILATTRGDLETPAVIDSQGGYEAVEWDPFKETG